MFCTLARRVGPAEELVVGLMGKKKVRVVEKERKATVERYGLVFLRFY